MASRRRNLFVLAFVAGLVAASLYVISPKETKLGLDLSGGTELIYQGRPTPQNPEVQGDDIERSIEIIRDRTDSLGVSEPEINQIGTDSVRIGLPDVQNADRAISQVGDTAQLFFYDWEPNVIPNPNAPEGRGTESPFPRLYDAVTLASQQEPECFEDQCTTTGPTYYLFDDSVEGADRRPRGGEGGPVRRPAERGAASAQRDPHRPAGDRRGPRGAAAERPRHRRGREPGNGQPRLLRHQGPPRALGRRHPRAGGPAGPDHEPAERRRSSSPTTARMRSPR